MPVPEELAAYLAQARSGGLADNDIRKALTDAGWSPDSIDEALGVALPTVQGVKKTSSGTRQKILLVLLCLTIIGGGLFHYRLQAQKTLRAEILGIWRGNDHLLDEEKVLAQYVVECRTAMNASGCVDELLRLLEKKKEILWSEYETSEKLYALVKEKWMIVDARTKSQVKGYYELTHSDAAAKLRTALNTLNISNFESAQEEYNALFESGAYDGLLQLQNR